MCVHVQQVFPHLEQNVLKHDKVCKEPLCVILFLQENCFRHNFFFIVQGDA